MMAKDDKPDFTTVGRMMFPDEFIREFYRAAAVGGIIAHEGDSNIEHILRRAFAIADEATRLRNELDG
jgi:hypothetical protein